jgi:hypothetical protein
MTTTSLVSLAPGWVHLRRERPALTRATPAELLALTARLPGTFRLGSAHRGEVYLLGELPDTVDPEQALIAQPAGHELERDAVESALASSGLNWRTRGDGWVVPANADLYRELSVRPESGRLIVEAVLLSWSEITAEEKLALERVLCRAQLGLRFARCEVDAQQARLVARVDNGAVEGVLVHALGGVAAGVRLLARETAVVLTPEVAHAYSTFFDVSRCREEPLAS